MKSFDVEEVESKVNGKESEKDFQSNTTLGKNADFEENEKVENEINFEAKFFSRRNLVKITIGSVLSVLSGISIPLFLLYFGLALQKIPHSLNYSKEQYHDFMQYIYCLIGVTLNSFFSGWLSIAIFETLAENFVKNIKRESFQYLLQMDEDWHRDNDHGSVSSKMIANCALIREGYGIKFSQLISNVSQFLFGFVVGFYRGWRMALVMSASLPLVAAAGFLITKIHKSWGTNTQKVYSKSGTLAYETLNNIKLVKSYCLESYMFNKYYKVVTEVENVGQKASIFVSLGMGFVSLVVFSSYSLGFWYGGVLVADSMDSGCTSMEDLSCFTVANVFSIFFVITNASIALGQSTPSLGSLVKGSVAFKELSKLFKTPRVRNQREALKFGSINGEFKFKDVSFNYPGTEKIILKNFNLTFQPGKVTALIGGSGCGKSSILKLILRLYDPDKGKILLDRLDIKKYDLAFLREQITIVDQESKLFNDTIRQNILYGNKNASEEEIEKALKLSQAWDFINSFKDGLDTPVGNQGSLLSGGQRQRIAIARAIVRNSSVIILDEATSGLDVRTESLFTQAFQKHISEKRITVIMIAHRLQTISFADQIVVLDSSPTEGIKILEQGSRSELESQNNGIYSNLIFRVSGKDLGTQSQSKPQLLSSVSDKTLTKLATFYSNNSSKSTTRHYSLCSFESLNQGLCIAQKDTKDYNLMVKDLFNDNLRALSVKLPKVSSLKILLLLKKDIHFLILGIISASIQGASFPMMGYLIGKFVTSGTLPTSDLVRTETGKYSLYFLFLAILIFLTTFAQNSFLQISGERLIKRLRAECFYSLLYQDIQFHEEPNQSAIKLCEVLAEDTRLAKSLVGENIGLYTQNIVTVLLGFVISFTSSMELTLIILGFFLLLIPTGFAQSKIIKGSTNRDIEIHSESSRKQSVTYIQEILQMHTIIKLFNLQQEFIGKYRRSTRFEYFKGVMDSHLLGLCWGFGQAVQNTAQSFGLWYGSRMTINQKIGIGELVQTILVLILTAASVCRSQIYATDKKKAKISANKIFSYIDRTPIMRNRYYISMDERCLKDFSLSRDQRSQESILEGKIKTKLQRFRKFIKAKEFATITPNKLEVLLSGGDYCAHRSEIDPRRGEIVFKNVSFSYSENSESLILSKVNFTIKSGEFVAMVGKSGSGKSTIFELLERFYPINNQISEETRAEGNDYQPEEKPLILINSMDVNELDVGELRSNISYVQQNPILFSGTIQENILLGRMEASIEEVEEAARMAQAYDFIMELPKGFHTRVGEGGTELSVGQKQRINLARAFIKNSSVLILDEPTASLDIENEVSIMKSIYSYSKERNSTVLLITHRLGTIQNCDRILLLSEDLENGGSTILEQGTHLEVSYKA
ncbi:ATP-binding cassette protein 3 [Cryptosporidium ubiquitum]|uniref:ATP-binding cassette protein 3 n=1 Tax=Cryptosporidium ubiquitum TaxID=857276 RepID=A0A1J4MK42_9CRYT|nr:ATP-binding cassette protein 3 [Cryptosporidium ubiquitum]OII73388.1 ATP-binding cassette protein 3 [Cryptosporidium ubiquitum]